MAVSPALLAQAAEAEADKKEEAAKESTDDVTSLSDLEVNEDPLRALSNEPSASSFGFSKPLLETPRTVSFVSEEQIALLGIASTDDLTRVVPGVYTNRRWGYQGGVDIRGTSADIYFRGMKRLQLQGHARTSLSGMDGIEVIKGPPSPIFGMGRIGGYMNLTPKAGRAKTGAYLTSAQGFIEAVTGSWDHAEASFGIGGPLNLKDRAGGYYIYGMMEDSGSWVEPVNVKQKIFQAATSVDNFVGPFRLEVGGQYQNSSTAGAYMNRTTQALIDSGTYIRGTPLVNLDSNGDGQVGFRETHLNSPVAGNVIAGNQPLSQRFNWPKIAGSTTLQSFDNGFDPVPGIPLTMKNYLQVHTEIDCDLANYMRTLPAGGPLPISGQLPVGFVLNPCNVGTTKVNPRRGPYEKEQDAKVSLMFMDLVYDPTPDFTVKNQLFFDRLQSFKNSQLPYGETQSIWAIEDKVTATKRIPSEFLPDWMSINSLASINHRITSAWAKSGGGDFDFRNDIMAGEGDLIVNASFWNNREDPSYDTGAPSTANLKSKYTETGVGLMFDIDMWRKTNLIVGARYDWAYAEAVDRGRFSETCTSASPCTSAYADLDPTTTVGMWLPAAKAESSDKGPSWSVSLSQQLPFGIRPYVTVANTSIVLDGANNSLDRSTVSAPGGFIGEATIKEVGIKASLFGGKVLITTAGFEQERTDVSNPLDPTASADVTSTNTRGVEAEIKWVPTRDLFVSAYAVHQTVEYIFATTANIEMTGRQLGFMDIIDPVSGAVYPAEAFVYGGRLQVVLPAELRSQYLTKNGNPETQFGLNASYQLTKRVGINMGANLFSEIPVTRITTLKIPEAFVMNVGAVWSGDSWKLQFNGNNILDERYYRPRNGDTVSGLVSSMPGRGWTVTIKHDFR
jgi:outer membrane receptor protein involved in Fe transport